MEHHQRGVAPPPTGGLQLPGGQFYTGYGMQQAGGLAEANRFFWGAGHHAQPGIPPEDKLGNNKQFEKLPIIPKRPGFAHLLPHLVLPPCCFTATYYVWSFVDRLWYWWVPFLVSGSLLLLSLFLASFQWFGKRKRPWFVYAAGSVLVATAAGFYFGNANFGLVSDYVNFKGMATYVNVNPSEELGDGFADAGEVYFKEGSRIDVARAAAFKNTDLFCVAPITIQELDEAGQVIEAAPEDKAKSSGVVDWWAVGRNCCNPSGEGFHCGELSAGTARSGLRELTLEDRQFYEFAVHQWTATHKIPSKHPLFFHWVTDPLGLVNGYMLKAQMNYKAAVTSSVMASFLCLVCARLTLDGLDL